MTRGAPTPLAATVLSACGVLAACSVAPQDIGRAPHMTPVGTGIRVERAHGVDRIFRRHEQHQAGSIWQDDAAGLFRDARAARVGDVVTVRIAIKDRASIDSASNRSREAKAGLNGQLDLALEALGLGAARKGSLDASMKGNTSTEGKGGISRSESIELSVAAVVTELLPNGNLVISGSQEIRVNFEVRVLEVAGVIRPRDVAADNSVAYDKVAEARVSYGGRGRLTEVQQPGVVQQIGDILAPY